MKIKLLLTLPLLLLAANLSAQKKTLDGTAYDGWKSVDKPTISDNGAWIFYNINPQRGDGVLEFYNPATKETTSFARGTSASLFNNDQWATFTVKVPFEKLRKAKIDKVKEDKMPKDTFAVVRLSDMSVTRFPKATSLKAGEKGSLIAYLYEVTPAKDSTAKESPAKEPAAKDATAKEPSAKKAKKFDRLVIFDVVAGDSVVVDSVKNYSVSKKGNLVLYTKEADSLKSVYAYTVDAKRVGKHTQLVTNKLGTISPAFALDDNGTQAAFMVTADTVKHALYDLYYFNAATQKVKTVAKAGVGMPTGYAVSKFGRLGFNKEGNRLNFNIAPKPKELPKDTLPKDEKFSLDLWSWSDTLIQPQQIASRKRIEEASYTAAYYPAQDKWVALSDYNMENVRFCENSNAPYALGTSARPYQFGSTFESDNGEDVYLVDVNTGKRTLVLEKALSTVAISPSASYLAYYNPADSSWYAIDTKTLKHNRLTANIPYPLYNESSDTPSIPRPYGLQGWTKDGEKMLVADQYDIWMLDPSGKTPAVNITKTGRSTNTQFRVINLAKEEGKSALDLTKPLLLASFNKVNKQGGYYSLKVGGAAAKLVEGEYIFTLPAYAKDTDRILFTRENFGEFRDLWTANERFENAVKITNANPQQAEYKWGSVQMMEWTDFNGDRVEGLLYLPENYDPAKRYPTIVYFYETHTELLFKHHQPQPSWSIIIPTVCTSKDYVVFMPDIKYKTGYPGKSCYDAVVSGTMALIERGIADKERIGLQGQSWGGYQIAYLVTQTDLYKCCAPGAPVSNMTSAYGGIRWGTGMARSFQYEHTQSRIGATPWQRRDLYIDNSPLFFADKMNTPMLMRHDDADEAVPWYQGIEYFVALRRLGKPVWMLNYNDEPHNLKSRAARMDWDKRMLQFFDYYLQDAPIPRWLKEGISITEKGIDQKYDTVK